MNSKRRLKKYVNVITFELIDECLTYKHLHPEVDEMEVHKIIEEIVDQRNDLIKRINSINLEEDAKRQFADIKKDIPKIFAEVKKLGKKVVE